jgi:adenylyl-sulfate kinase
MRHQEFTSEACQNFGTNSRRLLDKSAFVTGRYRIERRNGLSGAGKTTLAQTVALELADRGLKVEILDGDVIRRHLSSELGYEKKDRDINIRRIGFVSNILRRNGVIAIVAAISPYRDVREEIRQNQGTGFVEIFVDCPLEVLIKRDVKGLYRKAIRGEILNFTGTSDPYEAPLHIHVRTGKQSPEQSIAVILARLETMGYVQKMPLVEK